MPEDLKKTATQRALEQAEAYESVFAGTPMDLEYPDGRKETVTIPPPPSLGIMDDDCIEAYQELQFLIDTKCDREPDLHIPEQKLESGVILPEETKRGALLQPYRINGERLKPAYEIQLVQAVLGKELYTKLKAAGKGAGDVQRIWSMQTLKLSARQAEDPK
jgi:hypothetical protein